jgi:hypothetical protein
MTGQAASLRVPARTQNMSPRNLSQDDFWRMEASNMTLALVTTHWYQKNFANSLVHLITGKQMEYMALMNDPDLHFFQGMHDISGTNTCFFVELKNIPQDRKITYGKIVCDYKSQKKKRSASDSRWAATNWITLETWRPPLLTSPHSNF